MTPSPCPPGQVCRTMLLIPWDLQSFGIARHHTEPPYAWPHLALSIKTFRDKSDFDRLSSDDLRGQDANLQHKEMAVKSYFTAEREHKCGHSNLAAIGDGVKADGFTIVPAFLDEFELDDLRQARSVSWTRLIDQIRACAIRPAHSACRAIYITRWPSRPGMRVPDYSS